MRRLNSEFVKEKSTLLMLLFYYYYYSAAAMGENRAMIINRVRKN